MPDEVEVKPSVTIVTSDNLLEFQNKKIDEKLPVAVEPEPEETKDEKKTDVVEEEEHEDPKNPLSPEQRAERKKGRFQERISELTEARKTAEAKEKSEREARAKAESERDELRAKYEAPKPEEELGPEPQPSQFTDVTEYAKALKDHTAEKTKRDVAKEGQAKAEKERAERVVTTWKERVAATQKEMPDYQEKVGASDVKVSNEVRDAILESELGPQILYHFAEHPEDAERICKLTVGGALRELGKLEAKLEKEPVTPVTKSSVLAPVAEVSKASAPITPLRGAGKPVETRVDAQGVYHGTYAQYKKDRAAGKIK